MSIVPRWHPGMPLNGASIAESRLAWRWLFAGMLMAGRLGNSDLHPDLTDTDYAENAIRRADALIELLEKPR